MPRRDDYDYEDEDERRDHRDESHDDYQYDDYDDRPRRGRGRAAERASLPAIFMIILGALGLIFAIVRTVIDWTVGAQQMNNNNAGPFGGQNNDPAMKDLMQAMMIIGPIINVIWSLIVLFGGIQLKKLKSRGFVIFSCIWAMLPCSLCCILGLPFGIWALVVTLNDDVKRAFS